MVEHENLETASSKHIEEVKRGEEVKCTAEQELEEFSARFPELGKIIAKAAKYFK
jgi:hypothetical protein